MGRHPVSGSLACWPPPSSSLTEEELSERLVVGLREGLEAEGEGLGLLEGRGEPPEPLEEDGMLKELVRALGCWG